MFKVLRSGLLRYILHTCPKLWCNPCSKCYGVDCFGTYFTHVQSCDVTRLQSATEWTASVHTSHMSKAVMIPVFKVPGNGLYFGIYFTHVQSCDVTRVQSATEWTASVHILHTCPKLWCNQCSKCYGMDCFGTNCTHVQSCDVTRVQSATQLTASVYFTAHVLDLWSPWTGLHVWNEGRKICNGTVLFGSSLIWFHAGICTTLSIVRYHFHRHFFAELTNFHLFASYWDLTWESFKLFPKMHSCD